MKLKRFVVINPKTKRVMARFAKEGDRDSFKNKIEKGLTICKSQNVVSGNEVWEDGEVIEKSYKDDIEVGKYFISKAF